MFFYAIFYLWLLGNDVLEVGSFWVLTSVWLTKRAQLLGRDEYGVVQKWERGVAYVQEVGVLEMGCNCKLLGLEKLTDIIWKEGGVTGVLGRFSLQFVLW